MAASALSSARWGLTIGEHRLRRVPFGKRSWSGGITKVLRPLPVSDLRHILEMLADIVVVALQFLVEEVDGILGLQPEAGNMLQCIERQVEAAHFIENHHVEWSCGRPLIHVAVHMETALIGAPVHKGMNQPAVVVEREYNRRLLSEERIERHFVHAVRVFIWKHQGHQVDNVDNAYLDARYVFL